jgi:hypothetical protein
LKGLGISSMATGGIVTQTGLINAHAGEAIANTSDMSAIKSGIIKLGDYTRQMIKSIEVGTAAQQSIRAIQEQSLSVMKETKLGIDKTVDVIQSSASGSGGSGSGGSAPGQYSGENAPITTPWTPMGPPEQGYAQLPEYDPSTWNNTTTGTPSDISEPSTTNPSEVESRTTRLPKQKTFEEMSDEERYTAGFRKTHNGNWYIPSGITPVFPSAAVGGKVVQSGLANVHAGEIISPIEKILPQTQPQSSSNTFNINISIQGNAADDVTDRMILKIKRELYGMGMVR